MVLFVVALYHGDCLLVHGDVEVGHSFDVFDDYGVVGVLLIELKTLGSHVPRQVVDHRIDGLLILEFFERADYISHISTIVFHGNIASGILHSVGWGHDGDGRRFWVGRIHIQLKIRHYEEVVPQLALEVGGFARVVLDVGHDGYKGFGSQVALLAVFDGHQLGNHVLYVSAIFGQVELLSLDVVISSHISEKSAFGVNFYADDEENCGGNFGVKIASSSENDSLKGHTFCLFRLFKLLEHRLLNQKH